MTLTDAYAERQYASRYSIEPLTLRVHKRGELADADANAVEVSMRVPVDGGAVIFSRPATHTELGTYEVLLSSEETQTPGLYEIRWEYALDSVPQVFAGLLEVGESAPAYDALDVGFKAVIESVWMRFADLFDSPDGGPHLQVYFQSKFGRGRMAQLLTVALNKLNTVAQPHMTYGLEGPPVAPLFPFAQWGGLLEQALYIETIKHLIRSYTEQPEALGVVMARMDRRDYTSRWREVLADEQADYKDMMEGFKIAHMGLGRPRVLVAGGVYGNYGANALPPGMLASRGRAWAHFL